MQSGWTTSERINSLYTGDAKNQLTSSIQSIWSRDTNSSESQKLKDTFSAALIFEGLLGRKARERQNLRIHEHMDVDEDLEFRVRHNVFQKGDDFLFNTSNRENFIKIPSANLDQDSVALGLAYNKVSKFFTNYSASSQRGNKTRILDSIIMSAVVDPQPGLLLENVTLVFKNIREKTRSDEHDKILTILTQVGMALSLTGVVLTVISYLQLTDRHSPLCHTRAACVTVAAFMQYFLMASFCWMLVEGIYIYLFVVKVYNITDKIYRYHGFCWGLSATMVAASLVITAGKNGIETFVSDTKKIQDEFLDQLNRHIMEINKSSNAFIPADKTTNYYELSKAQHDKLLHNSITTSYRKSNANTADSINEEAKRIFTNLNLADRTERIATKQAFISLKDHKDNFDNKPSCRLFDPAKTDLGNVSKSILDKVNNSIRTKTSFNQWKNSSEVINWFKHILHKSKHSFIIFVVDNFYPSISESLLLDAINFTKTYLNITPQDTEIIMHCRKSLLFDKDSPWEKENDEFLFDVTMGSYDGAEICDLVVLFILNSLSSTSHNCDIGLYRDDGLALLKNAPGPQAERTRRNSLVSLNGTASPSPSKLT
ncbi:G-protein coupled receptor 64 [Stylophora pistillata]|uniref:G-protein coupled receptor 64 n=1 Tax=Stylophora pistillata TaxID=50429 RepID=A0A2B4R8B8_STYPI|nr:G-protein coupled receptor 64 [Stylophora pistillata]